MKDHTKPVSATLDIAYREKDRDLTQSYDERPYAKRKFNNQLITQKRHQKLRLHNDCGPTYDGQLE